MKKHLPWGYRARLLLLIVIGVLVTGALWKKKTGPCLSAWMQHHRAKDEGPALEQLQAEKQRLAHTLHRLNDQLGDGGTGQGWRPLFDILAQQGDTYGVALSGVSEEHLSERDNARLSTLPVSLDGRAEGLLNITAALEREARGIHLIALDLHTHKATHTAPRTLRATLYLQTLLP